MFIENFITNFRDRRQANRQRPPVNSDGCAIYGIHLLFESKVRKSR